MLVSDIGGGGFTESHGSRHDSTAVSNAWSADTPALRFGVPSLGPAASDPLSPNRESESFPSSRAINSHLIVTGTVASWSHVWRIGALEYPHVFIWQPGLDRQFA